MRFLIVTIVLLFWAIVSTAQNQPQSNNLGTRTEHNASNSEQVSPVGTQMSTVNAKNGGGNNQQQPYREASMLGFTNFEGTIAILTGIYVGLTGFYACISYKTLNKIKEQIILAERAAKAAENSANAAMDAEQAVLWIEQVHHLNETNRSIFSMRVWNSGKTIGTIFAGNGALQVGDIDAPPDPSVFNHQERNRFNELIVDPDSQTPTGLWGVLQRNGPLTTTENNCIASRANYLWACGYFRYRDIFRRVFERRYCYRYAVYDPIPAVGPKGEMQVAGPPDYNRLTRIDEQKA